MFRRISAFFWQDFKTAFAREPVDLVEFYCGLPLAKTTSPDQLIAAYIIQSFAKDFDAWVVSRAPTHPDNFLGESKRYEEAKKQMEDWKKKSGCISFSSYNGINIVLENKTLDVKVFFKFLERTQRGEHFSVNNVKLDETHGQAIYDAYIRLKGEIDEIKRKAETAKREMEESDQKWNIAEKLLGMKRNEFGALVPVKTAVEEKKCRHGGCHVGCEECCYCEDEEG